MVQINALCETGGNTVVIRQEWKKEEGETKQSSNNFEKLPLVKGMCLSKTCKVSGCTKKVSYAEVDDRAIIYQVMAERVDLPEL